MRAPIDASNTDQDYFLKHGAAVIYCFMISCDHILSHHFLVYYLNRFLNN